MASVSLPAGLPTGDDVQEKVGRQEFVVESARPPLQTSGKAKTYNRIKLTTGIASAVLSFVVLLLLVVNGTTKDLEAWAYSVASNSYVALLLFSVALGLVQSAVTLPLGFYSGFYIEHKFNLSNQTIWRWVWERLKGMLVGLPIGVGVLLLLYYCLNEYGTIWWLPVSVGLTFLSVGLARIAPVVILPLFYKLTPLENNSLKERILNLCASAGVKIEGIFSFNLSKNTKKANAAFTGIGRAKRIILGDTLLMDFTEDEIETVFAHELGHYTHHHIRTGIIISTVSTFLGLYITAHLYAWSSSVFGFSSITELAALPLLALWLSLFGVATSPIGNAVSRRHERQADKYAVKKSGKRDTFVSALQKLASNNLADPKPHPLVEFLFYSHPSIAKRIRMVETVAT
ncbi:MAG: M48 family metallopeptidase [Bacteroidota bacterium]